MFENCGRKMRTLGMISFVLCTILAGLMAIIGIVTGSFLSGLIAGAVYFLAGWVSAINMMAVADAAEYSETAAADTAEILRQLKIMQQSGQINSVVSSAAQDHSLAAPAGSFDANRVPAWKRTQMEQELQ